MDIKEFEEEGVPIISIRLLPDRTPNIQFYKVSGVEWSFENYAMLLGKAIRIFAAHFKENIDEAVWHIHYTIKKNMEEAGDMQEELEKK